MKKPMNQLIKELRINKNMTQIEFAKAIGLEHSQEIAAFESGRVDFPPKLIPAVRKAFGINQEKWIKMLVKIKEENIRRIVAENEK